MSLNQKYLTICLAGGLLQTVFTPVATGALPLEKALSEKPVLSHVIGNWKKEKELGDYLGLDGSELEQFRRLVASERQAVFDLRGELRSSKEVSKPSEILAFNQRVAAMVLSTVAGLNDIFSEEEMDRFLIWGESQWQESASRGGLVTSSGMYRTYEVYCTQFTGFTPYEIAVPDKYVKFAVLGWEYSEAYPEGLDYTVSLDLDGTQIEAPVLEVGPWNIDDNYWNAADDPERPRRLFTDLPQGTPEAQVAYYDGYNGGKDQSGRNVLNPAGCDLTPGVAADLGLGYLENDWVNLTYNWESDEDEPPTGGCLTASPLQATAPLQGGVLAVFPLLLFMFVCGKKRE